MNRKAVRTVVTLVVAVVALVVLLRVLPLLLFRYWWFEAVRHPAVFTRILWARVWLWFVGFALAFGAGASGILLARARTAPGEVAYYRWGPHTLRLSTLRRFGTYACWGVAVLAGLLCASMVSALWRPILLFLHRMPFGAEDPIFGHDLGFYVFVYPMAKVLHPLLMILVWLSLGLSAAVYLASGTFMVKSVTELPRRVFSHLSRGVGVILLLSAVGYLLQRYGLLFSAQGALYGAGYTDVKARLLGYWVMFAASLAAGGVFLWTASPRALGRAAVALAGWAGCAVIFLLVIPPAVQALRVEPNELELEKPYLRHAIKHTLSAYDLHDVKEVPYRVKEEIAYEDLQAERGTVNNIRVWDKGPLAEIYGQKQGLRSYYDFSGITVDRYQVEGELTQMMLSLRELRHEKLPEKAQTWVNMRLQYTHGYGLCANPVNRHTEEGFPVLLIRDIPPETVPELPVRRPQIYYGRLTRDYVFVKTRTDEFDYPAGAENRYINYDGEGGVPIGGALRKLIFALQLGDMNILLSDDLQQGSRVMYLRTVEQRVRRLAPYLRLDRDPYAVLHEGRLYWIQDAYTVSRYYPYSEPAAGGRYNYIRNSVKAVVDAYDGTVTFYVADDADPLIKAYSRIFPELYTPISEMPDGLRRHIRYPRDLFAVQADKYRRYHMRDPRVFYQEEDLWEVPLEKYRGRARLVQSYYVTMRVAENESAEFILMLPFTPKGKPNMIAWLSARCDGEHYGELMAFIFPKRKLVYGPQQVEARIDQQPDISKQLSLWSQRGSEVIRGNLLVIPVAGSILYVEPLYLQAQSGAVPQLKRIITSSGEHVAMRPTLEGSLKALFERAPAVAEEAPPPKAEAPAAARQARAILEEARRHFREAREALKEGDFARYGRRMEQMADALEQLDESLTEEPEPAEAEAQ